MNASALGASGLDVVDACLVAGDEVEDEDEDEEEEDEDEEEAPPSSLSESLEDESLPEESEELPESACLAVTGLLG